MTRHFFHVHDGEQRIMTDTVGTALEGIVEMRKEAIECACFAYDAGLIGESKQSCRVEVTDEAGNTSLTMQVWPSLQLALLKMA